MKPAEFDLAQALDDKAVSTAEFILGSYASENMSLNEAKKSIQVLFMTVSGITSHEVFEMISNISEHLNEQ